MTTVSADSNVNPDEPTPVSVRRVPPGEVNGPQSRPVSVEQADRPGPEPQFDRRLEAMLTSEDLETDLRRAKRLAGWLDTQFEVAGVRFGVDALLGLVPVVGDLAGSLIGMYPILIARRHRLGGLLQARMGWNLLLEWAVGSVPFVGDAFDVMFKANVRNYRLLEKAAAVKSRTAGPKT